MSKNQSCLEFNIHWNKNTDVSIPIVKLSKAKEFMNPLVKALTLYSNPTILDAGCGDGVHAVVLQEICGQDINYIGLDVSFSALTLTRKRFLTSEYQVIQADASNIPLPDKSINIIFSFGVIAYTKDPKATFTELVRVLQPGGMIGIWIFPDKKNMLAKLFKLVRVCCKIGGRRITSVIANLIVPILYLLPTQSSINLKNSSWQACKEIVMVNIAPSVLSFPSLIEVQHWFNENKIQIIHEDLNSPITLWGKKS